MVLLETKKLTKSFGGLIAVDNLDFQVLKSEILGLIGPNGAGKTTVFNLLTNFLRPTNGRIIFKERDIGRLSRDEIVRAGICRTFQLSSLFAKATVLNNVFTACHLDYRVEAWKVFLHTSAARKEDEAAKKKALEILELMGLASLKNELAQNLPQGYQRMLGICLALATNAELLLLDEPATGLNPTEKGELVGVIKQLRERGKTLIIIEHDMKALMSLADRIIVLNYGKKIADGSPEEIRNNREVIAAYLGDAYE